MGAKTVSQEDVTKALGALKELSGETIDKGLKGSGPTVAVSGEASGIGGETQLHQGKGDSFSSVKTHAGTATENASFAGEMAPNGTDVNFGAIQKSVLELVATGKASADQAIEMLKAMAPPFMKKEGKDEKGGDKKEAKKDDEKDEKEEKAEKSLADIVSETDDSLEVSEFLTNFVSSISKALEGAEARIITSVVNQLRQDSIKQENFNKSLAGAVVSLGEGLVATSTRIKEVESQPLNAPKSLLQKAYGGDANLSRTEILQAMEAMVPAGKLDPRHVVKFETTGEIDNHILKSISAFHNGK